MHYLPYPIEETKQFSGMSSPEAMKTRLAIVIPAYNHGRQLSQVLEKAQMLGYPVFVVDDGSTDATTGILSSASGVTVLRHERNMGKGAALLTGFSAAARRTDWVLSLDADGQHDPSEISALIQAVPEGGRPLVIGRRSGMSHENVPWTSRWGRGFSNFWVWVCSGIWLSDSQSGFRLYPVPETMRLGARARRFQFEVEILVRAAWSGIPILEVPILAVYGPPGERVSHFRPWLDFWRNSLTFTRLMTTRFFIPSRFRTGKHLPHPSPDREGASSSF
jgi:glycosyltransferase involved in cell wall biosynthesis